MLASMPKAPSDYHPVREKERLLDRRNFVLREMWENGYLTEADYGGSAPRRCARCRMAISSRSAPTCRRAITSPTRSAVS